MLPEEKLSSMGIVLPPAPAPLGSYIPLVQTGNLVFLSGILPIRDSKLIITGKVGAEVSLEEAGEAGRQCALNALSVLKAHLGSLNKVVRVVRLCGYVASAQGFTEQPRVLNYASDFLFEVFGEAGRHARAAVGVNVLPMNSPLEVEFIFEVAD